MNDPHRTRPVAPRSEHFSKSLENAISLQFTPPPTRPPPPLSHPPGTPMFRTIHPYTTPGRRATTLVAVVLDGGTPNSTRYVKNIDITLSVLIRPQANACAQNALNVSRPTRPVASRYDEISKYDFAAISCASEVGTLSSPDDATPRRTTHIQCIHRPCTPSPTRSQARQTTSQNLPMRPSKTARADFSTRPVSGGGSGSSQHRHPTRTSCTRARSPPGRRTRGARRSRGGGRGRRQGNADLANDAPSRLGDSLVPHRRTPRARASPLVTPGRKPVARERKRCALSRKIAVFGM